MTTQREPAYVIDPRARAMLAEMGVRVWLPQGSVEKTSPVRESALPVPVRREPPLRLPVMDAPPQAAQGAAQSVTLGEARYVIGNLPTEAADYDLVVLGEPCEGPAAELLANVLKPFASTAPRVFVAHMVASHNDAVNLHEQLATIPNQLILALGPHAAKALLDKTSEGIPFSKLRGAVHPPHVVVTYHPQQLLRQPQAKASCWQDIGLALRTLRKS